MRLKLRPVSVLSSMELIQNQGFRGTEQAPPARWSGGRRRLRSVTDSRFLHEMNAPGRAIQLYHRSMQRFLLSAFGGFLLAASLAAQVNTISVQGNVNKPGAYVVGAGGNVTLSDAIGRAGGILAGSGATAILYRTDDRGTLHEIKVPLQSILAHKVPDMPLKPGDVVYVPGPGAKPPGRPVIDDRIEP